MQTLAQAEAYWKRAMDEAEFKALAAFCLGVKAGLRYAVTEHAAEIAAMHNSEAAQSAEQS
jgi:hypothetical protein